MVKNILEAAKRVKYHKTCKKKAVTVEEIKKIHNHCIKTEPNICNMRIFTPNSFSFCGLLPFSEASKIPRSDIDFQPSYMKIFIGKSKTNRYRNGNWIYIARVNSELCPVVRLQIYLNFAKVNENSEEVTFTSITNHKNNLRTLRKKNVSLSYTRARELFLDVVKTSGIEREEFLLHSLRSGGASAATNAGVKNKLFKSHGRWLSESTKDGYVVDNI